MSGPPTRDPVTPAVTRGTREIPYDQGCRPRDGSCQYGDPRGPVNGNVPSSDMVDEETEVPGGLVMQSDLS